MSRSVLGTALLVLLWLVVFAAPARAHEVRPAYLELRQTSADAWDLRFRVPARGRLRLALDPRLPEHCARTSAPRARFVDNAYVEEWSIRAPGGIEGHEIRVEGLAATMIDVLVRIERLDGGMQVVRLLPSSPSFVVERTPSGL